MLYLYLFLANIFLVSSFNQLNKPSLYQPLNRINKLGWHNRIELRSGIEMVIKEYRKINNLTEKGQKKSFGYFQNNLQT